MSCEVCFKGSRKYKCPKCLLKYCSSGCYQKHCEKLCEALAKSLEESKRKQLFFKDKCPGSQSSSSEIFEDKVPNERLDMLSSDMQLMMCLRNPHLRALIRALNQSLEPDRDIFSAMMEPIFVELADHCLRIVEPREKEH